MLALGAIAGCASGGGGGGPGSDAGARIDSGGGGDVDAGEADGGGEDAGGTIDDDAAVIGSDAGPTPIDAGQDAGPACVASMCDDGDGCTIDGCASDGTCTHAPNTCDDGDACTADSCSGPGICRNDRAIVTGDMCGAAIDVSAGGTFTGTSTCAASDFSGACGAGDAPDVFLRLTLAAASDVTIDASGSSYDTVLSMGAGCAATSVGCDDDSAGGGAARLTRSALAAGTYYVVLDGKPGGVGGAWRVSVTVTPIATPETVTFPRSTDTMSPTHGYLWTLGSYVQGSRTTSVATARSVDIRAAPVANGLTCDNQDMRMLINGVEVGRFSVVAGAGTAPIVRTFTFPPITGPTYTLRYENVRQVASGCGSASFGDSSPASTVTLRP